MPPLRIAEALAEAIRSVDGGPGAMFQDVAVAAPGFINLRLTASFLEGMLEEAREAGDAFGRVRAEEPRHVNVEFVSANPTGPLTVGNARGAFVGDLLCRVLEGGGHRVTREYYFNDSGTQVRMLGASVAAKRMGVELPEDAYRGDYVDDLAREVPADVWEAATAPDGDRDGVLGAWAMGIVRSGIEGSLERLGVHFDVWRSEASLHRRWLGRPRGRATSRGRSPVRIGGRHVVPLDDVR